MKKNRNSTVYTVLMIQTPEATNDDQRDVVYCWSSVLACSRPMSPCGLCRPFIKQLHEEAWYSISHSVSRKIF